MKVAGIVSEFNPFHSGHGYLIKKTKALLGDNSAVICVMSGNFVQRGDCAVLPKHARAEAAVLCGADLIIELPLPYVLSSAEIFAHGAVSILHSLGVVTHLAFGSEAGDISPLFALSDILASEDALELMTKKLRTGSSYAAARQYAADRLAPQLAPALKSPNNLLGIEYISSIKRLCADIDLLTVPRAAVGHDSMAYSGFFASATLIREMLLTGENADRFIPPEAAPVLSREIQNGRAPVSISQIEQAVISRLRMMDERAYSSLPGASEGLGLRLMRYAKTEPSLALIAEKCKTKRYAMSRIRRLILCAALGIDFEVGLTTPPYIRLLAANETGLSLLRQIARLSELPVITKTAHAKNKDLEARRLFEFEASSTDLYSLAFRDYPERLGGREWKQGPVIVLPD